MGLMARRWVLRAHPGLLEELDLAIGIAEDDDAVTASAPAVSTWSVGQQLEHLWRADRTIVTWLLAVRDGTEESHGKGSTVPGRMVMWLGRIPRGKGRAPNATTPTGKDGPELAAGLREVRAEVESLGDALDALAASTSTRRHPLLGCYTAAQWLRFAHVHHVHHRRIVDDILRQAR